MCGVAGIYHYNKKSRVETDHVKQMMANLKHRGPDSLNIIEVNSKLVMGHTRLKVIDLNDRANQPYVTKDGSVLSYNGEIYNYRELRKIEKEYITESDTEVLALGLIDLEINFLSEVEGMYAFAFWNEKKKELMLCRDHIGIKPLYYYDDGQSVIFSSEIKAMLEVIDKWDVDEDALADYFKLGYIPEPHCIVKDIKQVQPGGVLIFSEKKKDAVSHYSLPKFQTKSTTIKELENELEKTIKRHLVSDVEVALMFSGGIDSTCLGQSENIKNKIKLYSTFCMKNKSYSEDIKATEISSELNKKIEKYNEREIRLADLKAISYFGDDLFCDPALISNYLFYEGLSSKYKVVLQGDGGDELFAGYHTYKASLLSENKMFKYIRPMLVVISWLLKCLPEEKEKYPIRMKIERVLLNKNTNASLRHLLWRSPLSDQLISDKLSEKGRLLKNYQQSNTQKMTVNELMKLDLKTYLCGNILKKVDRMSMAFSIESRVPFLSKSMIAYSHSIDSKKYKMNLFKQKIILKDFLQEKIGKKNSGQKKTGFGYDLSAVFLNDEVRLFLNKESVFFDKYVKRSELNSILMKKNKGYNDYYSLFSLLMFKLWIENFQEKSV